MIRHNFILTIQDICLYCIDNDWLREPGMVHISLNFEGYEKFSIRGDVYLK